MAYKRKSRAKKVTIKVDGVDVEVLASSLKVAKGVGRALKSKVEVDQDEDADDEPKARVYREPVDGFKGKRIAEGYLCPISERHGVMERTGDSFACTFNQPTGSTCGVWSLHDLNPRLEHFVVGEARA